MKEGKKRFGRKLLAAIAAVTVGFASINAMADLTENFDIDGVTNTPLTIQGSTYTPEIIGGVLSIIKDGVNSQGNTVAFNQTDTGLFANTVIDFDFRMQSLTGEPADGMSMMLIPTSVYGASGPGAGGFAAENPSSPGAFGIGFQIWRSVNGDNDVSVFWDAAQVARADNIAPAVIDLDSGVMHHAHIEITSTNFTSNVLVQVVDGAGGGTLDVYNGTINMPAFENRVQFAGRTGGANADGQIDNLSVVYSNPLAPAPMVNTDQLFVDFDSIGGTGFATAQHAAAPGPAFVTFPSPNDNVLQLTNDGVGGQNNQLAIAAAANQSQAAGNKTTFQFVMTTENGEGSAADGFGVAFLPTANFGISGQVGPFSEEVNLPGTLGVGFDTHDNGGEGTNSISLHFDGQTITSVDLGAPILENGLGYQVEIDTVQKSGGSEVSVTLYDSEGGVFTPIANHFVPGLNTYEHRVAFNGRTGGLNSSTYIDNVMGIPLASEDSPGNTFQRFDGGDTNFQLRRVGDAPGPQIMNGGPTNNYLRLIHDGRNNNRNAIAFDMTVGGDIDEAASDTTIQGGFDFRATSDGADAADGIGFMLIPTATYGTSGEGAFSGPTAFAAEEPNYAGVFGIGIDLHPAGTVNEVSIHWDGGVVAGGEFNIDPSLIDLDNGQWHHLEFLLEEAGGNTLLSLFLVNENGQLIGIASQLEIPGMSLYDYRVEIAARTGGLNVSFDLDNIRVTTIPEPGTIAMMLLGLGAFAGRRRKA